MKYITPYDFGAVGDGVHDDSEAVRAAAFAAYGVGERVNVNFRCPVCLGFTLDRPYEPLSYDICPQCYVEFGLEDSISLEDWKTRREEALTERHGELRAQWIAAGRPVGTDSWVQPRKARQ